jgi:N-acetylmuramoyl-L-alanine amidase
MLEAALICMALNVYHESRGEPIIGQQAVALVVWNRSDHDQRNVCAETFKRRQFSWTITGARHVEGGYKLNKTAYPKEKEAWNSALFTARLVLRGKLHDFTNGSTHYHSIGVHPKWSFSESFRKWRVIGRHVFYQYA